MSIGRLRRHLDLDAIARVKAGIKHAPKALKRVADPRPASDYRAARRNRAKGHMWHGIKPTDRFDWPTVRLNRSERWLPKKSYSAPTKGYAGA